MLTNRPLRRLSLVGLLALLALLLAPYQSQLVAAQRQSETQRSAVANTGPGLRVPSLDARPLLDARRSMRQTRPLSAPAGTVNSTITAVAPTAQANSLPGAGAAGPLLAQHSQGQEPQSVARIMAPQPSSTRCEQVLYNPTLDDSVGWDVLAASVIIDPDVYTSFPHSLRMIEDTDEQLHPTLGTDWDAFGQYFYLPEGAQSLLIQFQVYNIDESGPDDLLYYSFYGYNETSSQWELVRYGDTPQNTPGWIPVSATIENDPDLMSTLAGYPMLALVFETVTDGRADGSGNFLDVSVDDVQLKFCNSPTVPTGSISGSLLQSGAGGPVQSKAGALDFTGAQLLLGYYESALGVSPVDVAFAAADGSYSFSNVGALPAGGAYQVWYINDEGDDSRVSMWAGRLIETFVDGEQFSNMDLDVTDVELGSPAHEAQSLVPASFSWLGRGLPDETYYLCVYNPNTSGDTCASPVTGSSAELTLEDLQSNPSLAFAYGEPFGWYVAVAGPDYNGTDFADAGVSYYANSVYFVEQESQPPPDQTDPNGQMPRNTTEKDWTVMVYIAGDNNLGDPERYPNPTANLQGQFNKLKQLAASHPNINLVTLTDFYDSSGTQICYLKPDSTQDCQQLDEQDTSDPALLQDFISRSLVNFPAQRTMLILSDHGHSISGIASDETESRTAVMSPDEIRTALQGAGLSEKKLDILFYNVCLMGSFEVAFDASAFADYMVASANEIWVLNLYDRLLPLLKASSSTRAIAAGMVTAYRDTIQTVVPGLFISSAAYDLSRVPTVNTALSNLGKALADNLTTARSTLGDIRGQAQVYDSSGNLLLGPEDAFVDLHHFATLLAANTNVPAAIKTAAQAVLNALGPVGGASSLVIASQQLTGSNGQGGTSNLSNASGLSIFYPNGETTGQQPTLTNEYLNKPTFDTYKATTRWDEYVEVSVSSNISGGPMRIASGVRPIDGVLPGVSANLRLLIPLMRR